MKNPKNNKKHDATTNHATKKRHVAEDLVVEPTAELESALGLNGGVDAEGDPELETVALSPAEQITATQALERVRPRAMGLRAGEVGLYRVIPAIAIVNVRLIHAAVAPHRSLIPKVLPFVDVDRYDGLEDTALGLIAAANIASKVVGKLTTDGEFHANLGRARELRGRLLPFLQGLAMSGHVPMKVYTDIFAGRGARDAAQDCVDLAVAFRQYASAIAGKHPISDADINASEAVGTWLLRNLKVRGAHTMKAAVGPEVELRNRIATILTRDYEDASIIAHYFLREGYLKVAPPIRSRLMRRTSVPTTTPTPAPAPSPNPTPAPTAAPAPAPGVVS
jgi:hypothetical protein